MNPWTNTDNLQNEVKVYYDLLTQHLSRYPNKYFVESGTYVGNGVHSAIKAGFTKCYSIEIQPHNFCISSQRFSKEIADGSVVLIHGNSENTLKLILNQLIQPATFWLDAHCSYIYGDKLAKNCPIIDEINMIATHPIKNHTVLIDDVNQFNSPLHDMIDINDVINHLRSINPGYQFRYLDSLIPNNILVAHP